MMFRLLSLLLYPLALSPILFNFKSFSVFPWDVTRTLDRNIEPYLTIMFSVFALYSLIRILEPLVKASSRQPECTSQTRGEIKEINFSSVRINHSPRFRAVVNYLGIEREFDLLPERFHFNFEIGDEVIVRYQPDDKDNATLDVGLSIASRKQPVAAKGL